MLEDLAGKYIHTKENKIYVIPTIASILTGGIRFFDLFICKFRVTRDRSYDFKNIFAEKFSEKIGVFDSKQSYILGKINHNISI
jgi:hypothetical protein